MSYTLGISLIVLVFLIESSIVVAAKPTSNMPIASTSVVSISSIKSSVLCCFGCADLPFCHLEYIVVFYFF